MLESNPNLTWRDVQHVLVNSSDVVDSSNSGWFINDAGLDFNHNYGFGRVNAKQAVALSKSWSNVGPEVSYSTSVNPTLSIPDLGGGSLSTKINIGQDIKIESVEIPINSDHTHAGDLTIKLTSPKGTTAILSEGQRTDSSTLNFTFSAKTFWGETSKGDWTLTIEDLVASDKGNLDQWGLKIYGTSGSNFIENITEHTNKSARENFSGSSGLTYASSKALQEIQGLSSYISHIEETLDQSPGKATGDWIIGTQNLKRQSIKNSGLGIAKESTDINYQENNKNIREFTVSSEVELKSFISESIDSLNGKMIYAYPEILHDTTTRNLIPSMESNLC